MFSIPTFDDDSMIRGHIGRALFRPHIWDSRSLIRGGFDTEYFHIHTVTEMG